MSDTESVAPGNALALPAVGDVLIVSINYSPDHTTWAMLFDNLAIGWLVDPLAAQPPFPIVIGTLPPPTGDQNSPQWGKYIDPYLLVPDHSRQRFYDFLTWLATNNGLNRKLSGANLFNAATSNAFQQWAVQHPDLAFEGDPPAPPEADEEQLEEELNHARGGRHRGRHHHGRG